MSSPSETPAERLVADENAACDRCGQFGAMAIAGQQLCPECVTLAGCGCGDRGEPEEA